MTTTRTETGLLWPAGFSAAIEAAQASAAAGQNEQEQLAAGIVAYCTVLTEIKMSRTLHRNAAGDTPAEVIAKEHVAR